MELIKISDDVFINPSLVTSGEDQNFLYRQLTRAQAEGFRDKIVDTINHSLQEHR